MDVPYTRNGEREKKEGEKRSSSVCGWLEGSMEPRQREKESGSGLRSSLYIRVCVTYLSLSLSLSLSLYLGMNISQTLNKGEDGREEHAQPMFSIAVTDEREQFFNDFSFSLSLALQFGVESHFSWRNFIGNYSIIAEAGIPATHFPTRSRFLAIIETINNLFRQSCNRDRWMPRRCRRRSGIELRPRGVRTAATDASSMLEKCQNRWPSRNDRNEHQREFPPRIALSRG